MSYLYTVYHMTFQSGLLSLSLPSFFWSGHSRLLAHSSPRLTSYIQYVQSTYVHIICLTPQSFLSGKIGCFPALRMIKFLILAFEYLLIYMLSLLPNVNWL